MTHELETMNQWAERHHLRAVRTNGAGETISDDLDYSQRLVKARLAHDEALMASEGKKIIDYSIKGVPA